MAGFVISIKDGSEGRIRTFDLRVMSPTSYRLLHLALMFYHVFGQPLFVKNNLRLKLD